MRSPPNYLRAPVHPRATVRVADHPDLLRAEEGDARLKKAVKAFKGKLRFRKADASAIKDNGSAGKCPLPLTGKSPLSVYESNGDDPMPTPAVTERVNSNTSYESNYIQNRGEDEEEKPPEQVS